MTFLYSYMNLDRNCDEVHVCSKDYTVIYISRITCTTPRTCLLHKTSRLVWLNDARRLVHRLVHGECRLKERPVSLWDGALTLHKPFGRGVHVRMHHTLNHRRRVSAHRIGAPPRPPSRPPLCLLCFVHLCALI